MERINLPLFYQLGSQLHPLVEFTAEPTNRRGILQVSIRLRASLHRLLASFPALTVCRASGMALIDAIDATTKWLETATAETWQEPDKSVDFKFQQVIDTAKEFEVILSAELQTLATYHPEQKGIYSTPQLIEEAENILPSAVLEKMGSNVVEEIQQSGRCLAFDNSTASGFHILRATEAVLHQYYISVCKPKSKTKLDNWGAYIGALHKLSGNTTVKQDVRDDVSKVIALLQQIKDQDRNLIMHPEIVLTPDEAFTLFEIGKGAIIAMADKLQNRKTK